MDIATQIETAVDGAAVQQVSLVIPTIGRPEYLDLAIESVLGQRLPFAEIVVFDNSPGQRLQEYSRFGAAEGVSWAKSGQMLGALESWNTAVGTCSSEYVCILGDDDLLCPLFHDELQKALLRSAFVVCPFDFMDHSGAVTVPFSGRAFDLSSDEFRFERMAGRLNTMVPGICFRRATFVALGGFIDSTLPNLLYSDDLLWFRIAAIEKRVAMVPLATWKYRVHDAQIGHIYQLKAFAGKLDGYCTKLLELLLPLGVPAAEVFPSPRGLPGYRAFLIRIRSRLILNSILNSSSRSWWPVLGLMKELLQLDLPVHLKLYFLARCAVQIARRILKNV